MSIVVLGLSAWIFADATGNVAASKMPAFILDTNQAVECRGERVVWEGFAEPHGFVGILSRWVGHGVGSVKAAESDVQLNSFELYALARHSVVGRSVGLSSTAASATVDTDEGFPGQVRPVIGDDAERADWQAESLSRSSPATEVSYGRTADESEYVRTVHRGSDFVSLGSAFTRRTATSDLRNPVTERSNEGFWSMSLSTEPAQFGAPVEVEIAQSSIDPETGEGFSSSENRLISLGTSGNWQGYKLALGYQSIGNEYEAEGQSAAGRGNSVVHPKNKMQQGREGTKTSISKSFGNLGVTTLAELFSDQVQGGQKSKLTTQRVGATLNYTLLTWPQLGMSLDYATGERSGFESATGVDGGAVDTETIAGSIFYADTYWSGSFYVEDTTGAGIADVMDLRSYYLGASIYPSRSFTLSSGVGVGREEYAGLGANTDSYQVSLTASYIPLSHKNFRIDGYSEYSTQQNAAWYLDIEYYYTSLGVNWLTDRSRSPIRQWSFEIFHDQYIDNSYREGSTGGFGFWFMLKSLSTPSKAAAE